ncbi:CpsB/CapC family capsule biosynthesis tyrosine phosphatase [Desulfosporosinus sp. BG]|uniref:tyrosine-protein phosphatase n=1 Tax=Desulfosporosinus sp. BG TaxID=1633135 RepID=UPI00083ACF5F|nr:CpsB/CapC family capsule biosynthesis tyrosine phosphatase [Desulfosporosinus sp. BG]ODA40166.1 Manganese-dependent protein-tyrosine phosphatase [Desulfosporosinus sp. BG]
MIDTHSHILPGVDDGSKNIDETLGIVRQLHEAGFKTLIATPHVLEGASYLSPAEILAATELVRQAVAEEGIPVEILPGAENYIFPDMAKWVRAEKLMTLGNTGKYLLLELPLFEIPHYTDQVFFELQVERVTPILAHPERYKGLIDEPERLLEWAKKGVLFQLDYMSLSGKYGPKSKELAETLLRSDLIHFVGSDAHRVSRREGSNREALQSVQEIVGEGKFRDLTVTNPQRVLDGDAVQSGGEYSQKELVLMKTKEKRKRKGFWARFRS